MKTFAAATIVSLTLAASPFVMAQTQQQPQPSPPPAASQDKATPDKTTPNRITTTPGGATQPMWYSHQAGEMRASKLIGSSVKNEAGETIGDINEIVLSKDGDVAAVVVGVGGFLGIGEREVAVSFESLRLARDTNSNTTITMNATKDSLKAAPQWQWTSDRPTAPTGSGTNRPVAK